MCDFKPGDEIVCVDATNFNGPASVVAGSVYVVDSLGIYPGVASRYFGTVVIFLIEAKNFCTSSKCDIGFNPNRFRKVTKSKTDIAAWLAQPSDFEEPKRVKEKAK